MWKNVPFLGAPLVCVLIFAATASLLPKAFAQEAGADAVAELDKALAAAKESSSSARQRLGVRRAIRDAEGLLAADAAAPGRFAILEFLFRAQQQLTDLDDDSEHREALLKRDSVEKS